MAKSIYEILDSLETETSVPGIGMVSHSLPREMLPTAEQFENDLKLLAWAKDNDVLHQCLQSGIQKRLIDIRAVFKACKKDDEWSKEYGQKNVNNSEWKVVKRPSVTKSREELATEYLASMSPEELQAFIAKQMNKS